MGEPKLTKAQRNLLELAARSPTGNPWPLLSVKQRTGGAVGRMFEQMKARGLFDALNCITEAGRAALEHPQ